LTPQPVTGSTPQPVTGLTPQAVTGSTAQPVFYYDVSSPYAYLAAARVDDVLPVRAEWRPIAFGVIVRRNGKIPWSFQADRDKHFAAIAGRAANRGLPEVHYPEGWPVETYSLAPLRAALLAEDQDCLRALSYELFRTMFVEGRHLADEEAVLDAAECAGMDRDRVRSGIASPEIRQRLRDQTEEAAARGVTGVPTVLVGQQLFWGDDRLEDAAAAVAAA
jgi:2-hydroxychromene-2-carboxylate isomerase